MTKTKSIPALSIILLLFILYLALKKHSIPNVCIAGARAPWNDLESQRMNYINAIMKIPAAPIILPTMVPVDKNILNRQLSSCDGVIIPGGIDVDPSLYHEEPHPLLGTHSLELDQYSLAVIDMSINQKIPLLGICKGLQLLNVYFGGSLYQDLSMMGIDQTIMNDHRGLPESDGVHTIIIEPDSFLSRAFRKSLNVSSHHHQTVKQLGNGLRITARSPDGVVEGVEHMEIRNVVGVQFHPERMPLTDDGSLPLFQEFGKMIKNNFRRLNKLIF